MFNIFKKKEERSANQTLEQLLLSQNGSSNGIAVNVNAALALPEISNAVQVIAESIASLPIELYKTNKADGDKSQIRNHSILKLLNSEPNGYQSAFELKNQFAREALTTGSGFLVIEFNNSGLPSALHCVPTNSVTIKRLPNFRLGYQVTHSESDKPVIKNYQQEEIIHLKWNPKAGDLFGNSPIKTCSKSIALLIAARDQASTTFANKSRYHGIFHTDQIFNHPEALERLKSSLTTFSNPRSESKALVLENGLRFQPISASSQESELLATRKYGVVDIARAFNINPIMLQDMDNGTIDKEVTRNFVNHCLAPWLTAIESALELRLLSNDHLNLQFDTRALLKASTTERMQSYSAAIGSGVLSINECRKLEGFEQLTNEPNADKHMSSFQAQAIGKTDAPEPKQEAKPEPKQEA